MISAFLIEFNCFGDWQFGNWAARLVIARSCDLHENQILTFLLHSTRGDRQLISKCVPSDGWRAEFAEKLSIKKTRRIAFQLHASSEISNFFKYPFILSSTAAIIRWEELTVSLVQASALQQPLTRRAGLTNEADKNFYENCVRVEARSVSRYERWIWASNGSGKETRPLRNISNVIQGNREGTIHCLPNSSHLMIDDLKLLRSSKIESAEKPN